MKNQVTIKDIAKRLEISISTVSRALADKPDISKKTKRTVKRVAKEMGYRPNPIALSLKSRRSKIIGLVVPEFVNSFFPTIIMAIQDLLYKKGYTLMITQSNESAETEARNLRMLQDNMVEGILMSVSIEGQNTELYQSIIDSGTPIVFFNRACKEINANKVVIDDFSMSFFVTEHLIYSGKRHIVYFAGPDTLDIFTARKNGYLKALSKHNIEINQDLIVECDLTMEHGQTKMLELLDSGVEVDAVSAICDLVAFGAMQALKSRGISIPEQIAVVGFSESWAARVIEPNLTSIAQPLALIGETATDLLLNQIDATSRGEELSFETVTLEAKLNIRESSRVEK